MSSVVARGQRKDSFLWIPANAIRLAIYPMLAVILTENQRPIAAEACLKRA